MPVNRFYLPDFTQPIIEDELAHLKVTRAKVGDSVELVDGKGTLATATLSHMNRKKATVEIQSIHHEAKRTGPILAQAIPRLNRLDTILEKGCELGASSFWLFPGDLSEKKELTPQQKRRAKNITINAIKQCGLLYLPQIEWKGPLITWEDLPTPAIYGDPKAKSRLVQAAIIIIGPESGFSKREEKWLKEHATSTSFHHNILRTDTAAIASLAIYSNPITT